MKKTKEKNILIAIIIIIIFIVFFVLTSYVSHKLLLKKKFTKSAISFAEKNDKINFQINDIDFFSGCDAKNKDIYSIENLYQYTDIAIFITSPNQEKTLENTLKSVYIDNIKFIDTPSVGNTSLYYKNVEDFAKSNISDQNIINDRLDYTITSDDNTDLSKPVLYNNLANPIVLSYVNQNIKDNYTFFSTSTPITYDGSLLKRCGILLNSIKSKISFDINIVNNLNQSYKCTVYADIPLENDNNSIYDGNIILKKKTNFIFLHS